ARGDRADRGQERRPHPRLAVHPQVARRLKGPPPTAMPTTARFDSELGSFVDEICADLCRFECATAAGCSPSDVSVEREVMLAPEIHADIRVEAPKSPPFFVENKLEYGPADLVARIRRKYGKASPAWRGAQKLAVLLD